MVGIILNHSAPLLSLYQPHSLIRQQDKNQNKIKKAKDMKQLLFIVLMMTMTLSVSAQARIKFDKVTHDYGTFKESDGVQTCVFTFTNKGDKPLVINQAVASCGCTVPTYTKKPVMPGEAGEISVKYNGTGKFPGRFKKSVTVRTNGSPELTRLYIEGEMTE